MVVPKIQGIPMDTHSITNHTPNIARQKIMNPTSPPIRKERKGKHSVTTFGRHHVWPELRAQSPLAGRTVLHHLFILPNLMFISSKQNPHWTAVYLANKITEEFLSTFPPPVKNLCIENQE